MEIRVLRYHHQDGRYSANARQSFVIIPLEFYNRRGFSSTEKRQALIGILDKLMEFAF